ncbi:MAG: SMC-Scp complex subunit ScpB [Ruminococcaceae bacterium]|nr:SMC-Scp complex subunit ScpB [Oscillospiraceae bacterium]
MSELFTISDQTKEVLEAVLFAAGHPITYEKLSQVFEIPAREVKNLVEEYAAEYNSGKVIRGIMLLTFEDSCQLCTKEDYIREIRTALGIRRGGNLSASSLETLSIIAYNQPVTRAYIDTVRGVDSSYAVSSLVERGLIESKSRLDAPGRPMLYTTTTAFLRCFGLTSLEELPALNEGDTSLLESLKEMGGENAATEAEKSSDTND